QEGIILFMATIGITFFLEGFGQSLFGSEAYPLNIGIPRDPVIVLESVFPAGILLDGTDLWAAVAAGALVALLVLFFQTTRAGRALRAVADDHQAAMSVGIPLKTLW